MDEFAGQISLFALDPELAEQEARWLATPAVRRPKCSECGHPVHAQASVAALAGPSCAAKVGRIVLAARNARRSAAAASLRDRRRARRARRSRAAA